MAVFTHAEVLDMLDRLAYTYSESRQLDKSTAQESNKMQNLDAIFDLTNEITQMQRNLYDKLAERRDLLRGVDLAGLTEDQISDLVLRGWEKENKV